MKNGLNSLAAWFLVYCALTSTALAQLTPLDGAGFRLGDDVAMVKAALKTNLEPENFARPEALPPNVPDPMAGKTFLHLRTKGIWVFFDERHKAEAIRFDAPFAGNVLGIQLGDDAEKIVAKLGKPIGKSTEFLSMPSYRYAIDDTAYAVFDLGADGVMYIFIRK